MWGQRRRPRQQLLVDRGQHVVDNASLVQQTQGHHSTAAGGRNNTCGLPGPLPSIARTSAPNGEGLKAWHSMVARWDPKVRSRSVGILLELMRFVFTGDLPSKMAEYERAVLTFQKRERRDCVISNESRNVLEQTERQPACVTPRDERRNAIDGRWCSVEEHMQGSRQRITCLSQLWETRTLDELVERSQEHCRAKARAKARTKGSKGKGSGRYRGSTEDAEHYQLSEMWKTWSLRTRVQKHRDC